jgi:RimJ/RimL family protein N-acetyltransferase
MPGVAANGRAVRSRLATGQIRVRSTVPARPGALPGARCLGRPVNRVPWTPLAPIIGQMTTMRNWPLLGLRLRTPRLELRLPSLEDLDELASLAAAGVHDPAVQPFGVPWTDVPPDQLGRGVVQFHWRQLGEWTPGDWTLNLVVDLGGVIVGTQGVSGRDFAVLREARTGSWLGRRYHRQGIGSEMRAAVLHLAFAGLGAEYATSDAFMDNAASLGVSRKLGYVPDGIERQVIRGQAAARQRLRLDRAGWQAHRRIEVAIIGLAECLPDFGLPG